MCRCGGAGQLITGTSMPHPSKRRPWIGSGRRQAMPSVTPSGRRMPPASRPSHSGHGGFVPTVSLTSAARLERERAVVRHHSRPAARQERADVLDGLGHGEPRGRIAGAGPVELHPEARAAGVRGGGAVADGQRPDLRLPVVSRPQEGGALGRAQPLVAVAAVVGGAERVEIEGHHPRRVGAVHEDFDTAPAQLGDQPFDRQHQRGRARHVIEQGQPRTRRDLGQHRVDHLVRRPERER